ncbi:MAG: ribosome biogenesis GTP-binding protein YihA/YsxC [Bacteroidales bacterium]|nr:ribosome biogenesis GTP-binding protein YihA/YsxC [Bacteroidales bacterium]MDD4362490.1 ribosome biogenesis GTP-binding protein YihA/YsxC [Bacteroidales bacterium]
MEISSASFVISNTSVENCPKADLPEFAFIGRSNVGKSSLINMLMNQKNLAKTSSKPGKTLLINHFLVNNAWYLVDLPGYGYAKVSIKQRDKLHRMISDYVLKRPNLQCLFVLLDARHQPQEIDLEFLEFLGENQVPFALVFTKTDKCKKTELNLNIENYRNRLLESWESLPPLFLSSAEKKQGKTELLDYLTQILKDLSSQGLE